MRNFTDRRHPQKAKYTWRAHWEHDKFVRGVHSDNEHFDTEKEGKELQRAQSEIDREKSRLAEPKSPELATVPLCVLQRTHVARPSALVISQAHARLDRVKDPPRSERNSSTWILRATLHPRHNHMRQKDHQASPFKIVGRPHPGKDNAPRKVTTWSGNRLSERCRSLACVLVRDMSDSSSARSLLEDTPRSKIKI